MKNCAFIEISIINEEKNIRQWLKINQNTACELIDYRKYYIKINGNQFLKMLKHYQKACEEYAKMATNDIFDLCYIKFAYNGEYYDFSYDCENQQLMQVASTMYNDFKSLICIDSLDYDDVIYNITKDIKNLEINSKFDLQTFWNKYGIIGDSDKQWLCKQIFDFGKANQYAKLTNKPFTPKYLRSGIRTESKITTK